MGIIRSSLFCWFKGFWNLFENRKTLNSSLPRIVPVPDFGFLVGELFGVWGGVHENWGSESHSRAYIFVWKETMIIIMIKGNNMMMYNIIGIVSIKIICFQILSAEQVNRAKTNFYRVCFEVRLNCDMYPSISLDVYSFSIWMHHVSRIFFGRDSVNLGSSPNRRSQLTSACLNKILVPEVLFDQPPHRIQGPLTTWRPLQISGLLESLNFYTNLKPRPGAWRLNHLCCYEVFRKTQA